MTYTDHAVKIQQYQRFVNLDSKRINYGALLFKDPGLWARSIPARFRDLFFGGREAPAYVVAEVRKHAMNLMDNATNKMRQLDRIKAQIQQAKDELKHMEDLQAVYESANPKKAKAYVRSFIDQLNALSVELGKVSERQPEESVQEEEGASKVVGETENNTEEGSDESSNESEEDSDPNESADENLYEDVWGDDSNVNSFTSADIENAVNQGFAAVSDDAADSDDDENLLAYFRSQP